MAKAPDTWSGTLDVDDPADGPGMDTNLDGLKTASDSIDNTQIAAGAAIEQTKLDIGAILHNAGVSTQIRLLWGRKSVTLVGGVKNDTVDFSTEAAVGAVDFGSGNPYVLLVCENLTTDTNICTAQLTARPSTTGFSFRVEDQTASGETVFMYWFALGNVA